MDPVRAVYEASADRYAEWAGTDVGPDTETPFDMGVLDRFAEIAATEAVGPVADLGCGPGRVAAFLADRGLDVLGLDLSHAMVRRGRAAHAGLSFLTASVGAVPLGDRSLGGLVSWYSIIHTTPRSLPTVFAEWERVLAPGGVLLVAFQAGDGTPVDRADAFGTPYTLTNHRHSPELVAHLVQSAGLISVEVLQRGPVLDHETTPQAFVLARAPR